MEYKIGSLADLISGGDTAKTEIKKSAFELPVPKPSKKVSFEKKVKKAIIPTANNNKEKKVKKLNNFNVGKSFDKPGKKGDLKKNVKLAIKPKTVNIDKLTIEKQIEAISQSQEVLGKNKRKKLRRLNELLALKSSDQANEEEGEANSQDDKINDEDGDEKTDELDIFNDEELKKRTVFVGNLPNSLKKSQLKKLFSKYGEIQSVRFRGAPLADPRVPKKVAIIKQEFHPKRTNINGFVCFKSEESAVKAVEANGTLVKEHHLRVDLASNENGLYDNTKAIFIGNLDFSTEEDHLWNAFTDCGNIQSVRIVRDKKTNMGKGFGFVNFVTSDAVELALKLDGTEVNGRAIRLKRIQQNPNKKSVSTDDSKKPYNTKKRDAFGNKNRKRNTENLKTVESSEEPKIKRVKKTDSTEKGVEFEGVKSEKKKKKSVNKGELLKKKMVKKLAPKPK